MFQLIEDYAAVGDTQTAALVGRNGSIDWLCLPRFDSGACFAALLGTPEHGRWLLAPAGDIQECTRRYRGDSLVLESTIVTAAGTIRVIDFMPPRSGAADLIRIVEGVTGEVPVHMELVIRFDYGSIVPWVHRQDGAIHAIGGPDAMALWTPVETVGVGLTTQSAFTVRPGERYPFVLMWYPSHERLPTPLDAFDALQDTEAWWRDWSAGCTYNGPARDLVYRSAITLKALTYAPTGGIVAAATTSLPEFIGGVRNWDYRFCWLRDASQTLRALIGCGFHSEAAAWRDWLVRAVAGDPDQLQIMYGPAGERRLTELELPWLPGYEQSRPVRIGNLAVTQLQLDVYGEVIDALHVARVAGIGPNDDAWNLQRAMLRRLTTLWREPDEGIWEVRGERRHFTHSKVMAWVAFDRAIRAAEDGACTGPVDEWRAERDAIREEVMQHGFDAARQCFTQFYGSRELDASLLILPLTGFLQATDPRMLGTVVAIERGLMRDGLVYRYSTAPDGKVDGLPPGEGAFLPCSFWLVDNYLLQGRIGEGRALFERLSALANDVGLLSEEYDPDGKRLVGNFPQAFSHVSLVNSARLLANHV
ncbi:MAG TPA: glycoside hydrolase family 15 protein [Vicinamibacterales bacterium]|nr:glycoside hydrolase family 15 protein [Vicinamibacterales bacterium]